MLRLCWQHTGAPSATHTHTDTHTFSLSLTRSLALQEAKRLFRILAAKLDALSHLSYVPKPMVSDLEVKVDARAISMEEAAPVTVSAAHLKAPEEAHPKVCLQFEDA